MATTRDYLEFLNDEFDIAPVNSQEELQAAELLQQLMEQHRLETRIQEFEAPSAGVLPYRILMMLLFVGIALAGFYGTPAAAVGVVLVFISAALFLLKLLGYDFLSGLGPRAQSQNVIGVHRAEGPLVMKGSRPIVIVAHYDTPRESFLYSGPFAGFLPLIKRLTPVFVGLASVFGLFQLFSFVPLTARRVLWVLGLISALPLLVQCIDAIYQRFSSCTEGANDNKAALAAMLGVLGKVRPGDDMATGFAQVAVERRAAAQAEAEAREAAEAKERADAVAAMMAAEVAAEQEGIEDEGFDEAAYASEYGLDEVDELDDFAGMDDMASADDFEEYGEAEAEVIDEPASTGFHFPWPFRKSRKVSVEPEPAAYDEELVGDDAYDESYGEADEDDLVTAEETYDEGYGLADEGTVAADEGYGSPFVSADEGNDVADYEALDEVYEEDELLESEVEDEGGIADEPEDEVEEQPTRYGDMGVFEDFEYDIPDAEFEVLDSYEDEGYEFESNEPFGYGEDGLSDTEDTGQYDLSSTLPSEEDELPVEDGGVQGYAEESGPTYPSLDSLPTIPAQDARVIAVPEIDDDSYGFIPVVSDDDFFFDETGTVEEESVEEEPAPVEEEGPFVPSFARVRTKPAPRQTEPEPEVAPQVVTDRYEEVVGVRHGKKVIESLRMLPISCDLEYIEPKLISRTVRPQDDLDRAEFGVISAEHEDAWSSFLGSDHERHDEQSSFAESVHSFFGSIGDFFGSLKERFFGADTEDEGEGADRTSYDPYDPDFDSYDEEQSGYDAYEEELFEDELDEDYGVAPSVDYEEPLDAYEPQAYEPQAPEAYEPEPQVFAPTPYTEELEASYDEFEADYDDELELEADYDDELDASYADEDLPQGDEVFDETASNQTDSIDTPAPDQSGPLDVLVPGIRFEEEQLPTDAEIELMDETGLTEFVEDDLDATGPQVIMPAPKAEDIDDPMWGKSEYQPPARSVSRRAALFDLPDPYVASTDPFTTGDLGEDLRLDDDDEAPRRNDHWKGGATTRSGLRMAEDEETLDAEFVEDGEGMGEADSEPELMELDEVEREELRDAILSMSDDELIAHDIWFVALGASELNHAGMNAFLREYRSKIRGAFMINLSCIGAGSLNMLTHEGLYETRRADRRILRMLTNVADDLRISIGRSNHSWEETDVTQAMRKSVRALTIMGLKNGVPALSHTAEDVPEALVPGQASDVSAMVTELIRRS